MALKIEDYALIGDCETAALVGRDGSIDWLCLPRFDSNACFAALVGTHENGRWLIAPRAGEVQTSRRYRDDTLILETRFETDQGAVVLVDFMPVRSELPVLVRIVRGLRGSVAMHAQFVLRYDYGHIVPWVRRCPGGLRAVGGPDAVLLQTDVKLHGKDFTTVADFTVAQGQEVRFTLSWYPAHRDPPPAPDADALLRADRSLVARVGRALTYRGAGARGRALAHHAQGPDARPHRRDRGRAHDLAARADRRQSQLGLSLLLAARRHAHAVGLALGRLRGRGHRMARVAAAGRGWQPLGAANRLRRGRRAAADRADARMAERL